MRLDLLGVSTLSRGRIRRFATVLALLVLVIAVPGIGPASAALPQCNELVRLWAQARWGDIQSFVQLSEASTVLGAENYREFLIHFSADVVRPAKAIRFVANCSTGEVWDSANFRPFEGGPLGKLDGELRSMLLRGSLPERINVTVGVATPIPLLSIGSIFVPDQVDLRIWSRLSQSDHELLRDYWTRFENAEGAPRTPEGDEDVIDKARSIVIDYNTGITWPLVQGLLDRLRGLPEVVLLSPPGQVSPIQTVDAEIPREALSSLIEDPAIGFIGLVRSGTFALDVSAKAIRADYVWSQGYTGYPVDIGMIDTGVSPHFNVLPYQSRQFGSHSGTHDPCNHGTPVAGIIDSNHATYRGVSYNANLWNAKIADVDIFGRCTWQLQSIKNAGYWLVSNNVRIVSGTWGTATDDNGNSAEALWLDWYANSGGMFFAHSAGNSGDKVDVPAGAYNIVAVGATDDKNTISSADDSVAPFSAWGGTTDGRKKPDVVAPGVSITSSSNQNGWVTVSGTSFSAPHTAALAALLKNKYSTADYLELKGRLISGDGRLTRSWDSKWGWAYVDGYNSYWSTAVYSGSVTNKATWTTSVYLPGGATRTFALVWDREMLTETQVKGFSDLDLTLICPSHSDASASYIDNVERVQLTVYPGQTCELGVNGYNVPPAIGTQYFRVVGFTFY